MPKPPPAASAEVKSALRIEVEIDGIAAAPIDAAKLNATKPDYQTEEHRAWQIATLLGPAAERENAMIAATDDKGVTVKMPRRAGAAVPVLAVNRRGDVMLEMLSPDEPFPGYHGRGGRLNRPGDALPRLAGITKIGITVEKDAK